MAIEPAQKMHRTESLTATCSSQNDGLGQVLVSEEIGHHAFQTANSHEP